MVHCVTVAVAAAVAVVVAAAAVVVVVVHIILFVVAVVVVVAEKVSTVVTVVWVAGLVAALYTVLDTMFVCSHESTHIKKKRSNEMFFECIKM